MPSPAPCDKACKERGTRSILYPDIRREYLPPAPRECGLPPRRRCRRPRRPTQLQLRTRFLPRSIRPHSATLRLRCATIPANPPIAQPTSPSLLLPVQTIRYSYFGLCPEAASWNRPPSSRRSSSCRPPSFSRLAFLLRASASP